MPNTNTSSPSDARYRLAALLEPASLAKLGAIGAIVLVLVVLFLWTGGWLTSGRLTQTRLVDTFEAVNGDASGLPPQPCQGRLPDGLVREQRHGRELSTASVFAPGRMPVIGRFALAGGMPMMPDGPAAVRSMALEFRLADGAAVAHRHERHPGVSAQGSAGLLRAASVVANPIRRPASPTRRRCRPSRRAIPRRSKALDLIKAQPFSSGFANATYNSLNAFLFVDAAGAKHPGALVDGGGRRLRARAGRTPSETRTTCSMR